MPDTSARVAAVAGVSVATVSRVFSTPDIVRPETRQRVLAVAQQLGYTPNRAARSLANARTMAIGMLVPNLSNPYFADIGKAIQARARQKDYVVVLADSDEHEPDERELAWAMRGQVDGLIMVSPRSSADVLQEVSTRMPMVLANRVAPGVSSVIAPSLPGLLQTVEHVKALGHRTCCFIDAGRPSDAVARRQEAVRARCEEIGLEFVELGYFPAGFDSGLVAADRVLAGRATAVIAHNDLIALGVIVRLAQQGVRVPEDVSVVGVDDTVLAASYNPPLTTVRIPLRDIGRSAVDLLLDRLSDPAAPSTQMELPTALVVRASTARARQ